MQPKDWKDCFAKRVDGKHARISEAEVEQMQAFKQMQARFMTATKAMNELMKKLAIAEKVESQNK